MTEDLPEGWRKWAEGADGRAVWVYRPDVFDTQDFPPACLPTLYVRRGAPNQRPGAAPGDDWHITLYLEPEVRMRECDRRAERRPEALQAAPEVARRFAAGEVDHRGPTRCRGWRTSTAWTT